MPDELLLTVVKTVADHKFLMVVIRGVYGNRKAQITSTFEIDHFTRKKKKQHYAILGTYTMTTTLQCTYLQKYRH